MAGEPLKRLVVTAADSEGDLMATAIGQPVTLLARQLIATGAESGLHDLAGRSVFADIFLPPPRLVVISAGDDAQPLVRFAIDLGFRVMVVDHRPGLLLPERFPGAQLVEAARRTTSSGRITLDDNCRVILMTHHFADDTAYLDAVIRTRAAYIGMLGSPAAHRTDPGVPRRNRR